jgi:hypothetical protein
VTAVSSKSTPAHSGMVPQRAAATNVAMNLPPNVHAALRATGQPLDEGTREFSQPRFSHDFSQFPVQQPGLRLFQRNEIVERPPSNSSAGALRMGTELDVRFSSGRDHRTPGTPKLQDQVRTLPGPVQLALERSRGERLPDSLAAIFSSKFRWDLSRVTLHRDGVASDAVRSLGANAFARGNKIFFRDGAFQPGSSGSHALLAHELAHVVQQTRGSASPSARAFSAEEYARRASRRHLEGSPLLEAGPAAPVAIAADTGVSYEDAEAGVSVLATEEEAADRSLDVKAEADARRAAAGGTDAATGQLDEKSWKIENAVKTSVARKSKAKRRPAAPPAINSSPDLRDASAEEIQAHNRALLKGQMLSSDAREKARLGRALENTQRAADTRAKADTAKRSVDIENLKHRINILRVNIDALEQDVVESNERRKSTSSWVTGPVHAYGGAWQEMEITDFQNANILLTKATEAVANGNLPYAEVLLHQSAEEYVDLNQHFEEYGEGIQRGGRRVVGGLKVVKAAGAVAATVATGGAGTLAMVGVGAGYAGVQNIAGQASEIHFGLRDKINWGDVAFDTVSGALSGYLGGKLGNLVVGKLMGNPAIASLGRKAVSYAVADYIAGRASSTMDLTLHTVYQKARYGRDVTWEEFLGQLADQITDPTQAATDIIMGHANRYMAKTAGHGSPSGGGEEPEQINAPSADDAGMASNATADPYARTEQIAAQSPNVQRGNAAIGSARTLRPGELEVQTSATQKHAAAAGPDDPYARTVEITPDQGGARHGNAPLANERTLTPEELAREQADTARLTGESSGNPPEPHAMLPAVEPAAPRATGPIQDPVAASQALARVSREGGPFRLINDPETVRIVWENERHSGEAPPPAWVDDTGKLTVDTTRVRAPVRSSDVLAGPIQEIPAAADQRPLGQTQDSIPPERTSHPDTDEAAHPRPFVLGHFAPPEVVETITDPQTAQALYWQEHSQFMGGETEAPAAFTTDRSIYDANWKLAHGEGESPPAWRDQHGRMNFDASRVDIHQPVAARPASAPVENGELPSGSPTKPLSVNQEAALGTRDQPKGNVTAQIAGPKAGDAVVDSSITGVMYRVHDAANSKFYAQGRLGSHGELEIDLRTELADGSKSTALKGHEQFRNIVNFFKGSFKAIKGNWQFGANLDKVNLLTGQGMSIEEAAGKTWTAEQARSFGYDKIRVADVAGTPGQYTAVKVFFEPK